MKIAHFSCDAGASGDMLLGAMLDLLERRGRLPLWQERMNSVLGIEKDGRFELRDVMRSGVPAKKIDFYVGKVHAEQLGHQHPEDSERPGQPTAAQKHGHSHNHGNDHRRGHGHDHSHHHGHTHDHHEGAGKTQSQGRPNGQAGAGGAEPSAAKKAAPVKEPQNHGHSHDRPHEHDQPHQHGHQHHHGPGGHHHQHRRLSDIRKILEAERSRGLIPAAALKSAERIFLVIAEAEAKAHECDIETVHFHEVGAYDSIMDVIGFSVALDLLEVDEVRATPVMLGRGKVNTAHGLLDIPTPAVFEIRKVYPFPTTDIQEEGECLTPTGAAILAALVKRWDSLPENAGGERGAGAGTRDPAGHPNIVRLSVFEDGRF